MKQRNVRKIYRRSVSFLLSFLLVCSLFLFDTASVRAEDSISLDVGKIPGMVTATIKGDCLEITGAGEMQDFTKGKSPFSGLSFSSLRIGAGVLSLGDYAFYNCADLSGTLELPKSLLKIGTGAFSGDSAEQAPAFDFIYNHFTEGTVTVPGESPSPEPSFTPSPTPSATPEATLIPESSTSPESTILPTDTDEPISSALPEEAVTETPQPTVSPAEDIPAESAVDEVTSSHPLQTEDDTLETVVPATDTESLKTTVKTLGEGAWQVQTVTQQEIGENVFYPRGGTQAAFYCSQENASFRSAALAGGYKEAQRLMEAVLTPGNGQGEAVSLTLPVVDEQIILPELPKTFFSPEGSVFQSYVFAGWTEAEDLPGMVTKPGEVWQAKEKESAYFLAVWEEQVSLSIATRQEGEEMIFSVALPEGWRLESCVWQQALWKAEDIPDDTALLPWEDIPGETTEVYRRKIQPEDENRLFRCVLTLKEDSLLQLFSPGTELVLKPVWGVAPVVAENTLQIYPGSWEGGTITGEMQPIGFTGEDYILIPSCAYQYSGEETVVFSGWEGSDGKLYHPGEILRPDALTSLTATWSLATVRYVSSQGEDADGRGISSDTPYRTVARAQQDFSSMGSVYTNILILCDNVSFSGTTDKPMTITGKGPKGEVFGGAALTVGSALRAGNDLALEHISLTVSGSGDDTGIFSCGNHLRLGEGLLTDSALKVGAETKGNISGSTHVIVQSGNYQCIYGGCLTGGDISGGTLIQMSGGTAQALIGGGWYGGSMIQGANANGYGTEILLSGNAQAGVVAGGCRASSGEGVEEKTHIMIGGNASVVTGSDIAKGFVAGSGLDAMAVDNIGNARGGTFVEIRENAWVSQGVYGGSGDAWTPTTAQPTYLGTKGDSVILMTGGTVGSIHGGGNKTVNQGNVSVSLKGGLVQGNVYGGGCSSQIKGSVSVELSGGTVQGNVYGGGELAGVEGEVNLSVTGGEVEGSLYGGSLGTEESAVSAAIVGNTRVILENGSISGNVFGGGDYGCVGKGNISQGSISDDQESAVFTVSSRGGTSVQIAGGTVSGSVFGGGSGAGADSLAGVLFGSSTVEITGGSINGDVFGGGNRAVVAENTQVNIISGQTPITLSSVYGGGNLSGSTGDFNENAWLVQGDSQVTVEDTAGLITVSASIMGEGNLTPVKGSSTVSLSGLQGDFLSLQRADTLSLRGCSLTLAGETDPADPSGNAYSLSEIGNLRLAENSVLSLQKGSWNLGSLGNYSVTDTDWQPSLEEKNRSTLQLSGGVVLYIKNGMDYGAVEGTLWLDILKGTESQGGIVVQAAEKNPQSGFAAKEESSALSFGTVAGSHCFWEMGEAASQIDLLLEMPEGAEAVTGVIQVPVSGKNSVYRISSATIPQGISLLKPGAEQEGASLTIQAVNEEGSGQWAALGSGSYLLSQLPDGETQWNSGVEYVWKTGDQYPVAGETGDNLSYQFGFTCPSQLPLEKEICTVDLAEYQAGQEISEDSLLRTTRVNITLQREKGDVTYQSFVSAGKQYGAVDGTEATTSPNGSLTAYFLTTYYPETTGAQNMCLELYRKEGENLTPISFPQRVSWMLSDRTGETWQQYSYTSQSETQISLSGFKALAGGKGGFYPGPTSNTGEIKETLLLTADFSRVSSPLAFGDYVLALRHNPAETQCVQSISFTLAEQPEAALVLEAATCENGVLQVQLSSQLPQEDSRYQAGAMVSLWLEDNTGGVVDNLEGSSFSGEGTDAMCYSGVLSFLLPESGMYSQSWNLSETTLVPGEYTLHGKVEPAPGPETPSTGGTVSTEASPIAVTLDIAAQKEERGILPTLAEGSRLLDVSSSDASFTVSLALKTQPEDRLSVAVYEKVSPEPGQASYRELKEASAWVQLVTESETAGKVVVTVPKGTAEGTYRMVFTICDATGEMAAEEVFNFLVKS